MYSDTVTLFNHYRSKTADVWYPTVLRSVDLNADRAVMMSRFGAESADKAILHVKYAPLADGSVMVDKKPYLPPLKWSRLTNDELSDFVTFKGGTAFDFILHGDWGSPEPIYDADYDSDVGFYNYMSRLYDGVYAISSVAQYNIIPHFEILAK